MSTIPAGATPDSPAARREWDNSTGEASTVIDDATNVIWALLEVIPVSHRDRVITELTGAAETLNSVARRYTTTNVEWDKIPDDTF